MLGMRAPPLDEIQEQEQIEQERIEEREWDKNFLAFCHFKQTGELPAGEDITQSRHLPIPTRRSTRLQYRISPHTGPGDPGDRPAVQNFATHRSRRSRG